MDRIKKYKKIIEEVLRSHIALPNTSFPNLQNTLVIDEKHQHFLLLTIGWHGHRYQHLTVYHLEIKKDGRIWVHAFNSDAGLDKELIALGVAEEDIIGGMIEPYTLAEMEGEVAAV